MPRDPFSLFLGGHVTRWISEILEDRYPTLPIPGQSIKSSIDITHLIRQRHLASEEEGANPDPVLTALAENAQEHLTVPGPVVGGDTVPNPSEASSEYSYQGPQEPQSNLKRKDPMHRSPSPPSVIRGPKKQRDYERRKANNKTRESRKKKRNERGDMRLKEKHDVKYAEHYRAGPSFKAEELPIASTHWRGLPMANGVATTIKTCFKTKDFNTLFAGFTLVPFLMGNSPGMQAPTCIRDFFGRLLVYRSQLSQEIVDRFDEITQVAIDFVTHLTPPSDDDRANNSRGLHWYCHCGHHRQCLSAPCLYEWHRQNRGVLEKLIAPGGIIQFLSDWGCKILTQQFPLIAKRFEDCGEYHYNKSGIKPLFGLFWNFCLNAPIISAGVSRVHCEPHVDLQNIAIGLCMLFVYQGTTPFNHREYSWLVVWEAKVIIQVPPGVFVLYPSSLFTHFNIDISDLKFVTTMNGEIPTRENCTPLSNPEDGPGGRGSMVWFNQASMLQSSELNTTTIKAFKDRTAQSTLTDDGYKVYRAPRDWGYFTVG